MQMITTSSNRVLVTCFCSNMVPLFLTIFWKGAPRYKLDAVAFLQMHYAVTFGSQQVVAPCMQEWGQP